MSGVAVILLNWNSYDLLRACLHSLRNATYPDLRTYVVDNGSRDASEIGASFQSITNHDGNQCRMNEPTRIIFPKHSE